MVLVPLDKGQGPVNVGVAPDFLVAHDGVAEPGSVAFLVGFVHHVHSVLVAELVPARVVGVVAGADQVYVGLFHQFQVLAHEFLGHGPAGAGMVFVAVHALQLNHLAVYLEEFAVNFNGAESGLVMEGLRALKCYCNVVQCGVFRGPEFRPVYVKRNCHGQLRAAVQMRLCGLGLPVEGHGEGGVTGIAAPVVQADLHVQVAICKVPVQAGF